MLSLQTGKYLKSKYFSLRDTDFIAPKFPSIIIPRNLFSVD